MIRYLEAIDRLPIEIKHPILEAFELFKDEIANTVKKEDFNELKWIVRKLATAQESTESKVKELVEAHKEGEKRLTKLELSVSELAEAQKRTEVKVEELAEAQKRTEVKVEELAEAQKITEQEMREGFNCLSKRIDDLAQCQKKTEEEMREGFKYLTNQITSLGSRWGIYNEGTFRTTIRALMSRQPGVEVREGFYGGHQVDIIISGSEHILLEITSRMLTKDIQKIYDAGDDYKQKEGIEPILMVATSYISPNLMKKMVDLKRKIEIFSYEEGE
ncbi:MAG: DUF3782 domain-containing protein [bacterium]